MNTTTMADHLLSVLKEFDQALSEAGNEAFATALASADSVAEFGGFVAAVQNILCDLHMFLLMRLFARPHGYDGASLHELRHRFNRMERSTEGGKALLAVLRKHGQAVLELLLCLDEESFSRLPPSEDAVPEYLLRTLALERDLAWIQEFHVFPRLNGAAPDDGDES